MLTSRKLHCIGKVTTPLRTEPWLQTFLEYLRVDVGMTSLSASDLALVQDVFYG